MQFENCTNRWTFHPQALIRMNAGVFEVTNKVQNHFKVGDKVKIDSDVAKVKELQKGHGEWLNIMAMVNSDASRCVV